MIVHFQITILASAEELKDILDIGAIFNSIGTFLLLLF